MNQPIDGIKRYFITKARIAIGVEAPRLKNLTAEVIPEAEEEEFVCEQDQLDLLTKAAAEENNCATWNKWREQNQNIKVRLGGAKLIGLNLSGADLQKCYLRGVDFSGSKLKRVKLAGSNLRTASFTSCELTDVDFHLSNLNFSRFINAVMHKVSFNHAHLDVACFRNAKCARSRFVDASLRTADFVNADLIKCEMRGAKFELGDLRGARLLEVNLENADLRSIQIESASVLRSLVYRLGLKGIPRVTRIANVRIESSRIEPLEKRYVDDQNYISSFRKRHPLTYLLWNITTRCGQSLLRWALLSLLLVMLFGFIYSKPKAPQWLPSSLHSLFTSIAPELDFGKFASAGDGARSFAPYYFSVVTFSTLGFGDVSPVNLAGQIFVSLEVVLGYVMLGGLISIFTDKLVRRS